jgi:copper chaperone NosL
MKRLVPTLVLVLMAGFGLSACQEETKAAKPVPVAMTEDATGYYCHMVALEHAGPKAQIHLEGNPFPLWFPQVRDAIAFTLSPEEPKDYVAVYVSDMDKAESWQTPGKDNWVDAEKAWFVIGSRKTGGMGAAEVIPFGTENGAEAFVAEQGGNIVRLSEIPEVYVLGSVVSKDETGGDAMTMVEASK